MTTPNAVMTSSGTADNAYVVAIESSKKSRFPSRHHHGTVGSGHDLIANEILVWLLPTNMRTHRIKFGIVLFTVLFASFRFSSISTTSGSATTPKKSIIIISSTGVLVLTWIYWYYHTTLYASGKIWMDPAVPAENRLEMHVPLRLFETVAQARRAACLPQLVSRRSTASNQMATFTSKTKEEISSSSTTPLAHNILLLDDMNWEFQLLQTVEEALELVRKDSSDRSNNKRSAKRWSPIKVPGNWMLQGFDDVPIYTNQKYPFPCRPPIVPRQNPTGCYRLRLTLPSDWKLKERRVGEDDSRLSILLHGVESACFVYWNSELLGFFKDSRLPSEFLIPPHLLTDIENCEPTLYLVVARWSDGSAAFPPSSYVEDQDHWWMAGIHRSVEIIRRPSGANIIDYKVRSSKSGNLSVSVKMRTSSLPKVVTARLFADEQQTADGDWKPAPNELWSQQQILIEMDTTGPASNVGAFTSLEFSGQIESVQQWTAETPYLYTLVLEEQRPRSSNTKNNPEKWDCASYNTTQVESCRVGFRTIDITNGILRCNDRKIMICGINRHEHDPDHGKVVSLDRMKQDIEILKQNNFNAIRTSHYPAHSSFYKLCDFYGMYVCDEANIETHGLKPMGRLAHDRGWERTFVERVRRMVQRDQNHPCIIMWSLGNESGRGRNLTSARKAILNLDNGRPICYESGGSWSEGIGRTELTDIICPMYPNVDDVTCQATDSGDDRPIILSEYSHSMNNSNGNLHLYWRAFRKFERLQGGFIWDMVDQGLRKKDKNGRSYFGYGGDFGVGQPSDRQFCINGMFSPDRKPHPSVSEIKYLQQPVDIKVSGVEKSIHVLHVTKIKTSSRGISVDNDEVITQICLQIQNLYSFSKLSHLSWRWQLCCNYSSDLLSEGVALNENGLVTLDLSSAIKKIRFGEKNNNKLFTNMYYLNLEGFLNKDSTWANNGHVVATKQFPLKILFNDNLPLSITEEIKGTEENTPLRVLSDKSTIQISNGNASPFITIDKSNGEIASINWDGKSILAGAVKPNFLRAATDNDRGGMELVLQFLLLSWATPLFRLLFGDTGFSYEMNWKRCGLSQDLPPEIVCHGVRLLEKRDDVVQIEALISIRSKETRKIIIEHRSIYEIYRDGRISITNMVKPMCMIPSIPRIGISFRLSPAFQDIQYFGRGPMENYPDRKSGSHFGWWKTSASDMGYDYIVPSENGSRSNCQQICFESRRDGGLAVIADPNTSFSCSALLHSAEELYHALHTCDLDERVNGIHPIYVNIDHQLMGVGGDDSWSPCVYPDFVVKSQQEYNYKVWLIKISPETNL